MLIKFEHFKDDRIRSILGRYNHLNPKRIQDQYWLLSKQTPGEA